MPRKPKRPCSYPGCPDLTDGRFCEKHQKEENKRYEKYDRNPAVRRRYGRAWKRIRDSYAAEHPLCEECLTKVAFICVHNSCRSQIAEALGKHLAGDEFDFYSAGTETKPQINQDAVRLMKEQPLIGL